MFVSNVSMQDMRTALGNLERKYGGNILFAKIEQKSKVRIQFTLKVDCASGHGSARSRSGRKTGSACWHAHGHFFDALMKVNTHAIVTTRDTQKISIYGGNWQDNNNMKSLCECEAKN